MSEERKLYRLEEKIEGNLQKSFLYLNEKPIAKEFIDRIGKLRTLVILNSQDINSYLKESAEKNPEEVPKNSNCYLISEFPIIQLKKRGEYSSIHAIQFYNIWEPHLKQLLE